MASYGHLLAKMARGEELTDGEASFIESNASRIDGLMGGQLGQTQSEFDFIRAKTGAWKIGPMPVASAAYSTQTIGSGSVTTPTISASSGATWAYGSAFSIDTTNDRININALAGVSAFLVVCFTIWDGNATGQRALLWDTNDGGARADIRDAVFESGVAETQNQITHVRRVSSEDSWSRIRLWQDSGGNRDVFALMAVYQLR